jgi:hypothetical protein
MARIPGGVYKPFYPVEGEKEIRVAPFDLDVHPVTNGEFLDFVRANPRWRKSGASPLFTDSSYLSAWRGDLDPGDAMDLRRPVTFVSWFAAQAIAGPRQAAPDGGRVGIRGELIPRGPAAEGAEGSSLSPAARCPRRMTRRGSARRAA